MAEQNDPMMDEVMALLEVEPTNVPEPAPTSNIPAFREELAILVSTGKCKEAIGVNLSQAQVHQLDPKDVMKYYKRYETYVGAKTTDTMIDNFLSLSIKTAGLVVKIENADAIKNELKGDFIISKNLSQYFGGLALRYGGALALVSAAMITAKHVDFGGEQTAVQTAEQITEQHSVNTRELVNNTE